MQELETGTIVEVTHVLSGVRFRALIEKKSDGTTSPVAQLSLCRIERPYEKVRVALNGQVSWAVAATKFAALLVEAASDDEVAGVRAASTVNGTAATHACVHEQERLVHFRSIANQKKLNREQTIGWYIGGSDQLLASASDAGELSALVGDAARGISSVFRVAVVSQRGAFALDTTKMVLHGAFARTASVLTESQRRSFIEHGYLQIRDVVPLRLVNAALRRINHELGIPGRMIDGGVEGSAKLAGNVSNSQDVLNLLELSDAWQYVEALLGRGSVATPRGAQIALRFPELGEPREPLGTEWHTDGMRQGKLHPFSLLLGVALSDVREPLAGNFTVFPGSHRSLHALLTADGKLTGYADECYRAESVWGDGTLPDLGTPVQLLAARGDLVLAHPNLAHRGGLNFSPDIRYQLYFRLKHVDHAARQRNTDLWADFDGLRDLVDAHS